MLELRHINKTYSNGKISFQALKNINLKIEQGEFIAIMGASGSGKSTLLNILGFLDNPEDGAYIFLNKNVAQLNEPQLCKIRRHMAGFIFQQFHLLPGLTALDNVNVPLIYAGQGKDRQLGLAKLSAVGLAERAQHNPNEMSGGERQRVAIARSLMNNPVVLFADEPTGNLDTKSEEEILKILRELNQQGMTIVMVTHEKEIAEQAERIIKMRDGQIISDERRRERAHAATPKKFSLSEHKNAGAELFDHLAQAWRSITANKLRAFLSMLGVLIGVAAVIAMLAIGEGASRSIEANLTSLGSNLLTVRQGSQRTTGVSLGAAAYSRLTLANLSELRAVPHVAGVSGEVAGRAQVANESANWNTTVYGVSPAYARMHNSQPTVGRFFGQQEMQERQRVAVIGSMIVEKLFADTDPLGKTIKVNKQNFTVIGVAPDRGFSRNGNDMVFVPLTTAMHRTVGKKYLDSIEVEIDAAPNIAGAKTAIKQTLRKTTELSEVDEAAIDIWDMSEMQEAIKSTTATISILLGSVAAIALLVGGIGIMNIMLVSVTERTREIGLRKAIGAGQKDILAQFLIEAMVLTCCGGALGILLGYLVSLTIAKLLSWATYVSFSSILLSSGFSIGVGLLFGIWPARQAANLNTIEALRYE
ncbi:macrolide-specific efflux system MacB [Candidatus Termititenax persephonae]|uniref:Macrolide-specific efflux system MacB n=1 Tax=Candidatus Termititenax persephonae TaxID=2218525 RepID=A0A388TK40_9BACT|nr:macrolide-specific efflux system MacB [Candidatus Termititenax persephonae]